VWLATGDDGHDDSGGAPARALTLPLVTDDEIVGVAAFLFDRPIAADDSRRALVEGVAAQAGRALLRAGRRDREQEVTLVLQARLLPPSLPQLPDVELTARYLAATEGTLVGGDWYDAIVLPNGCLLLTVGDVVGRGPAAAAVMGQLRTLLHEAALRVDEPAAVVASVDGFAARTDEATGSTCVVVELDPRTGGLRYCRAGHPWPLVVGPSGPTWLDGGGGGPLGFAAGERSTWTAQLAPDECLVLFTDGAVERRGEGLEVGFGRLAEVARAACPQGPDAICEAVLQSLPPGTDDDVVLLVARGTHLA
jgi:serine phosphatase RsbU (regulator of sigma subunit)